MADKSCIAGHFTVPYHPAPWQQYGTSPLLSAYANNRVLGDMLRMLNRLPTTPPVEYTETHAESLE